MYRDVHETNWKACPGQMAIETVAIFLLYDSRETFIKDRHTVIPVTFGN